MNKEINRILIPSIDLRGITLNDTRYFSLFWNFPPSQGTQHGYNLREAKPGHSVWRHSNPDFILKVLKTTRSRSGTRWKLMQVLLKKFSLYQAFNSRILEGFLFVKRLGLGLGTWDLGIEWRIENRESRIKNRESKLPSPSADSKMPGATTHHPPPNF